MTPVAAQNNKNNAPEEPRLAAFLLPGVQAIHEHLSDSYRVLPQLSETVTGNANKRKVT